MFDPDRHCGAHPTHPVKGPCCALKGAGTPHPGIGRCRHHGGLTPRAITAGQAVIEERAMEEARQEVRRTLGVPDDVDPTEWLLRDIAVSAGAIKYYREQIDRVVGDKPDVLVLGTQTVRVTDGPDGTVTIREVGPAEHMWHKLWRTERQNCATLCALALRARVDERRVKLAEQQGGLLVAAVRGILDDLDLTPAQQAKIPEVVPRHLRAVSAAVSAAGIAS